MKKALKWMAALLLTPVVLFLTLAALLYCPPVQNWAVKQVAAYASEKTGMDISVERVRLKFPLDLSLQGFKMIQQPDTVADVGELVVSVEALPLLKGQVNINALELNAAKVNTLDLIPSAHIKGKVGRLALQSRGIDLNAETVRVNTAQIENSDLFVALNDSVPPDTTETKANWKINIDDLTIDKTAFSLQLPGDSARIYADMDKAVAKGARLKLKDGIYQIDQIDWNGGAFNYDALPLAMRDVNIGVDSLLFASPRIAAKVRQASFKEQRGVEVESFSGNFSMDDKQLSLRKAKLKTTESQLTADFQMDLNTFDEQNPGKLFADIDGSIGKKDIAALAPGLPRQMMQQLPEQPLTLKGHAEGNMQYVAFKDLHAQLPTAFDLKATGWVAHPTDVDRMRADVTLKGKTERLDFVTAMLPKDVQRELNIPRGIGIDGRFKVNGQQYAADFTATEGGGSVRAKGTFDARTQAYNVKASANNLQLQHFLPRQGLSPFSGDVTMQGRGTDFLDPASGVNLTMNVRQFKFGNYNLDGIGGDINLRNGLLHAKVNSQNGMVGGNFNVDGRLTSNFADLYLKGRISRADLKQLGLTGERYVVSGDADVHVTSDMKNTHTVKGHVGDFALRENRGKNGLIPLVNGDFDIDASMTASSLNARFDGRIDRADLYQLGVTDQPFSTSFAADLSLKSNLSDYYDVKGQLCNLQVQERDQAYYADNVVLDVQTSRAATHAAVSSGDFHLDMDAQGGYEQLLKQGGAVADIIQQQIKEKRIDQKAVRERLPDGHIRLTSGSDNVFAHLLSQQGYGFQTADIDLTSSVEEGMNGNVRISSLTVDDSIELDDVALALTHDNQQLNYSLSVANNDENTYPFKGTLRGSLHETGLLARATILDNNDKTGLDLGLAASMETAGIRLNVTSDRSVIGYKSFTVNKDNFVYIGEDHRVSADLKLQADDGAGAHIYTDDSDSTALQNVTLSMHRFDLEKVFDVLPFTPSVSGVLDGDYHVIQTADELTVSSDMTIQNLVYEHSPMGTVGTQLVYMPQNDGSHYVDAVLVKDGIEVGTLTGTYQSEGDGYLDADFHLDRFPLSYVNGFVPDQLVGLRGTGEGELTVRGALNKLDVNGEVYLDSSYLYSDPYGVEMRFADDPVRIQHSKLLFENFEMFANNDSPLNIQGELDFSNPSRMMLDVRMRAQDFLLIDAKENPRSEAYGKAYVNFFGRMNGPINQLSMRGKLDVLGNTDMTYVLKESALVADDQLSELVTFTDFSDSTVAKVVQRPDISGFDMDMSIGIDEQAHIVCALNADHSNYIDLIGGGDLHMTYDPANDLRLNGRYTLSDGEMKYALPVIPLRTFNIQEGSFIEFTGNPYDPTLNITATERLKTNVGDGSSSGRMVDFNCGVKLTETLAKPTVEFIIEAPEDMQVQNELNTKSTEERGKLAVSMLASGMYLADGNGTTNAAMSGALASFMQSEINNITGSALRSMGLDLSANMETSTDASGSLQTDYTFKFSKRLLNNRLRIIMGGRVSTGSSVDGGNGAFFDNFSMEYRLNQNETQYLKLFYERDAYDWLEGDLSQFGAGFMWRRKLQHFSDILKFKNTNPTMPAPQPRRDSLVTFTDAKE